MRNKPDFMLLGLSLLAAIAFMAFSYQGEFIKAVSAFTIVCVTLHWANPAKAQQSSSTKTRIAHWCGENCRRFHG